MTWLKTIWDELIGLFVDDGALAAGVLIWLLICWLLLPRAGLPTVWPPFILFAGLMLILVESVVRAARRR